MPAELAARGFLIQPRTAPLPRQNYERFVPHCSALCFSMQSSCTKDHTRFKTFEVLLGTLSVIRQHGNSTKCGRVPRRLARVRVAVIHKDNVPRLPLPLPFGNTSR
jgi:hypothetical protein